MDGLEFLCFTRDVRVEYGLVRRVRGAVEPESIQCGGDLIAIEPIGIRKESELKIGDDGLRFFPREDRKTERAWSRNVIAP